MCYTEIRGVTTQMGHETKHPIRIKSSSTAMPVFQLWCLSIFTLLSWHEIGRLKNDTEKCGAHVWWQFSVIKVWFCKHELSSMRLQAQRTQDFKTISYLSVNLRKSFCNNQIKNTSKKIAHRPVICFFLHEKKRKGLACPMFSWWWFCSFQVICEKICEVKTIV